MVHQGGALHFNGKDALYRAKGNSGCPAPRRRTSVCFRCLFRFLFSQLEASSFIPKSVFVVGTRELIGTLFFLQMSLLGFRGIKSGFILIIAQLGH